MHKGIAIVGTDTGVGKTAVAAGLGRMFQDAGKKVAYLKPAQSGGTSDTDFVRSVLKLPDESWACPYQYSKPLAPYPACLEDGQPMDFDVVKKAYDRLAENHDIVLVEAAGGLLVPVNEKQLQSDMIASLEIPAVFVVRPTLGTINHSLLSFREAERTGIPVLGFIVNQTDWTDQADPSVKDNPRIISQFSGIPHLGTIPFDTEMDVDKNISGKVITNYINYLNGAMLIA